MKLQVNGKEKPVTTITEPILTKVGHSARRIEGQEKVTGAARYTADLPLPGMLHAQLVTSPYAHALITRIDSRAAQQMPGVTHVLTAADLPLKQEEKEARSRNPLAQTEVVFYGQPVAVVLAESEAAALDGAALVQVEYQPLPVVSDVEAAIRPGAPLVRASQPAQDKHKDELPNVSNRQHFKQGEIDQGFQEAAVIVEHTYHLPYVHQSYLETQTCLAAPDPMGGLTVYASTQGLFATRREVAKALGLPLQKVKVVVPHVGGGFGAKGGGLLEPLCAALALVAKRPVLLSLSRMQDLAAACPMPDAIIQIKIGAKADGKLTALQARVLGDTGAYPGGAPLWMICFKLTVSYAIPHYEVEGLEVMTNRVGGGAYRAPGGPQVCLALEAEMDELAARLGLDPLEIRRRNLASANQSLGEVLARLEKSELWQKRYDTGPNEGYGLAIASWATCMGPASASCQLDGDGRYTVTTGLADITGASTSMALIAAEVLNTQLSRISVVCADSASAPHVGASGGSQITYNLGSAVRLAAEDAREQILKVAADKLEANPADLELRDDQIRVKGTPSKTLTLAQIGEMSTNDYEGKCAPINGRGNAGSEEWPVSYFAHLAHVRVDPETGEVTVLDYLAVHDVGFAINPAEVKAQLHGGVTQGLGWALYEQLVYDENGTLTSGSLMDYALQTAPQVPTIETELVFVPSEKGPFGAKGVGEPPIVPVAGAINNAIKAATGVRVTELPATPERILKALKQKR
jgi:CO/xanthine dehydrogenase Mo-binding subunit